MEGEAVWIVFLRSTGSTRTPEALTGRALTGQTGAPEGQRVYKKTQGNIEEPENVVERSGTSPNPG